MDILLEDILRDVYEAFKTHEKNCSFNAADLSSSLSVVDQQYYIIKNFPSIVIRYYLIFKEILTSDLISLPYNIFSSSFNYPFEYLALHLLLKDNNMVLNTTLMTKNCSFYNLVITPFIKNEDSFEYTFSCLKRINLNREFCIAAPYLERITHKIIDYFTGSYQISCDKCIIYLNDSEIKYLYTHFQYPKDIIEHMKSLDNNFTPIFYKDAVKFEIIKLSKSVPE